MKLAIHLCISGFTQRESSRHGVYNLSEKLAQATNACQVNSRVWLRPWNDNWHDVVEHIWLLQRQYTCRPEDCLINVYAYSWGGGWGATRVAHELKKCGLYVNSMVLCDAVYRHPNLLMRWMSLFGRDWWFSPTIHVPDNVRQLHSFHQKQNRPQGHELFIREGWTRRTEPVELHRTHHYMDDARRWHQVCLEEAASVKSLINQPEGV